MEDIAKNYELDLDGDWNKEYILHSGSHPNEYHEFVLKGMNRAKAEAGNSKDKFLALYETYVKKPIRDNPKLLDSQP